MGMEYYDSCPWSDECKDHRLAPAVALSKAGIPCVVWAEDALAFIRFVPTCLFSLQLFVPDELLDRATSILTTTYSFQSADPPEAWCEYPMFDRTTPSCYPRSVSLSTTAPEESLHSDDPRQIWLHPQSFFSFDVRDTSLSVTLDQFPNTVRFPTRPAFLDTLFTVMLESPIGFRHHKFHGTMMTYYGYLLQYTMRGPIILPSGELGPAHKKALCEVEEENRPYFRHLLYRHAGSKMTLAEATEERREIMRKLGKGPEVNRPLPRDVAAVEARKAKAAGSATVTQSLPNAT
ncbi:hypothetical protein NLJ89_g7415 [Agrocybe chaxingu]|uniref:Uncharacterized protein n=1 Tax=Agrocybe chaxingu TaxID=84603 RepID=A0A9W8MT55_9AGAR|nr:hypothetical protein NLJ89_g7415 [Agrocybe chaxingu]